MFVSDNKITSFNIKLPNNLKDLYITTAFKLTSFTNKLPVLLEQLLINYTSIKIFNLTLPPNLKYLNIGYNQIFVFNSELPKSLNSLKINGNNLKKLKLNRAPLYLEYTTKFKNKKTFHKRSFYKI